MIIFSRQSSGMFVLPRSPLSVCRPTISRIALPVVVRLNLSSCEILTASAISSQVLCTPIERSFSVEVLIGKPKALFMHRRMSESSFLLSSDLMFKKGVA